MCGIMGYVGNLSKKETYFFINNGLKALKVRGRDATGIYSSSCGALLKAPMDAQEFLKQPDTKKFIKKVVSGTGVVLMHTRASTDGGPENNENNHPLYSDDVVLIHNGVVSGDKIDGYKYKGETDTELILAGIQASKEKREVDRVSDGIKGVSGSLAISVYFRKTGNTYLYRHSKPMYVGKKGKTILFASTEDILDNGIESFNKESLFKGVEKVELPDDTIFKVGKGSLSELKHVEPKVKVYSITQDNNLFTGGSYYNCRDGWGDKEVVIPPGVDVYSAKLRRVAKTLLEGKDGLKVSLRLHKNEYTFTKDKIGGSWAVRSGCFDVHVEVDKLLCKNLTSFYPYSPYSVKKLYEELNDVLYNGDPFNRNDFLFIDEYENDNFYSGR